MATEKRISPLNLAEMLATPPPPIDYTLPGMPQGTVGLMSGTGGVGKSMLTLQLATMVASAGRLHLSGNWTVKNGGRVVIWAGEDSPLMVHHRIHAIADRWMNPPYRALFESALEAIEFYPLVGEGVTLMDYEGKATPHMQALYQAAEGARLVIVDTMRRFHDADENDNGKMAIFLKHQEVLAKATGASVLVLHHENKSGLNDPDAGQGALRGASAIVDNARWVCRLRHMTPAEAKERELDEMERKHWACLSLPKVNYGPPMPDEWLQRGEGGALVPGMPPEAKKNGKSRRAADEFAS